MVNETNRNELSLDGVRILFPNFEGRDTKFTNDGRRTFAIQLDAELAEQLTADGFNVKYPKPNPDIDPAEDRRLPYLPITVSNKQRVNPSVRIYIIDDLTNNAQRVDVNHNPSLASIDKLDISHVDVIINPYHWEVNGNSGIKPYLKAAAIHLNTDPFAAKYNVVQNEQYNSSQDDVDMPF